MRGKCNVVRLCKRCYPVQFTDTAAMRHLQMGHQYPSRCLASSHIRLCDIYCSRFQIGTEVSPVEQPLS